MPVTACETTESFRAAVKSAGTTSLVTVHFWASWAPQCALMNDVLVELAKVHPAGTFLTVEAENMPELSLLYEVSAVPTFVFLVNNHVVETLNGADAARLTETVGRHSAAIATAATAAAAAAAATPAVLAPPADSGDLNTRLRALTTAAPVMLFMKGSPSAPQCGFSRQIVGVLKDTGAEFSTFDILADEEVRQGLKTFSNWPTFPQLYIAGELVGGLDIVKELVASGEFAKMLPQNKGPEALNARLSALVRQSPVMLFMKGSPDEPRCGFSKQIVALLRDANVAFGYYDILGDEQVRQGLKTFSNWPTYPQLYAKGELLGGLDIVKEMLASGELNGALGV